MGIQQTGSCDGATFGGPVVRAQRSIGQMRAWWDDRAAIMQLSEREPAEREAAIQALLGRKTSPAPILVRALHASPLIACGAAEALQRMGIEVGIQTILIRSYDEEWLSQHPLRHSILTMLRRLEQSGIGSAYQAGLSSATAERDLHGCFDRLTLALSALRLLLKYGTDSPFSWWEQGLMFGPSSLPRIGPHPFAGLAYSLTDRIRTASLAGILAQHPSDGFSACARGLQSNEIAVMRTSVEGMRRLRDSRALCLLQPIAFSAHHPLALVTRKAIEHIAGIEAASLTLVRSSHADANVTLPEDLVRPADLCSAEPSEQLLRLTGG